MFVRWRNEVGAIAARWGFWHMGVFSTCYKQLFGEPPSTTLKAKPAPRIKCWNQVPQARHTDVLTPRPFTRIRVRPQAKAEAKSNPLRYTSVVPSSGQTKSIFVLHCISPQQRYVLRQNQPSRDTRTIHGSP